MVERLNCLERRLHPHHRGAPPPLVGQEIWQRMADERRHLSRQLCRLVLGARRGLLRRGRDRRSTSDKVRARTAGHAGRMGRGGELFLPAVGLSGQAARSSTRRSRISSLPKERAQRGGQLRQERPAGPVDLAHHLRLGRAGARRPRARHVCLGRRADQLHHRRRLSRRPKRRSSGATGRPTCTSSARTSCASTRSTGRPS